MSDSNERASQRVNNVPRTRGQRGDRRPLIKEVQSLCRISHDFQQVISEIKDEFNKSVRPILETRKGLVLKLGDAIRRYGEGTVREEDICMAIKFYLADEIQDGLISERDIERYCPDKWKRKTRPRMAEDEKKNDNLSFPSAITQTAEEITMGAKPSIQNDSAKPNSEKEYETTVKALADAKAQLQSITTEIKNKDADIETLKQERDELKALVIQCSIRPASKYAEQSETTNVRTGAQTASAEPFTIRTTLEVRGIALPLVIEVVPVLKKATVSLDEVRAKELGLLL